MATSVDVLLEPLASQVCTDISVLNDDLAEAQVETFVVTFSTASTLQVGNNSRATVSIRDSYGK